MEKFNEHQCIKCNYSVYESVVKYCQKSLHRFILCKKCQDWYKSGDKLLTQESKKLFLSLRMRGVNVEIEKDDGHKHIDLAITGKGLKLNIEVDGSQHYTCAKQSWSDIQRTYHSFLKGFFTIRLPNILVREKLDEVADLIVNLLKHSKEREDNGYRRKNHQEQLTKQLTKLTKQFEKLNLDIK